MFLYLKAAHIVFVVTWFAGLFYIVRLFVYMAEAADRPESERVVLEPQYRLMARRLWLGITWPSAIVTLIIGLGLLHSYPPPWPFWLKLKLGLVVLLFGYQIACHTLYRRFSRGEVPATSGQMRVWNEVATLFLVSIVFLVVLKGALDMLYGTLGLFVLMILLSAGVAIYRRIRQRE